MHKWKVFSLFDEVQITFPLPIGLPFLKNWVSSQILTSKIFDCYHLINFCIIVQVHIINILYENPIIIDSTLAHSHHHPLCPNIHHHELLWIQLTVLW